MRNTLGLIRTKSSWRLANLGHQKASITFGIHFVSEWTEKAFKNTSVSSHTRHVLIRALFDAFEIMHVQAIFTADALVIRSLALLTRIETILTCVSFQWIKSIVELLCEVLLGRPVEFANVTAFAVTIEIIRIQSLVAFDAPVRVQSTGFTLIGADFTYSGTAFTRVEPECSDSDFFRTSFMASVVVKTEPSLAVVFARHTVGGRAHAGCTIWTTFHAFEVRVS